MICKICFKSVIKRTFMETDVSIPFIPSPLFLLIKDRLETMENKGFFLNSIEKFRSLILSLWCNLDEIDPKIRQHYFDKSKTTRLMIKSNFINGKQLFLAEESTKKWEDLSSLLREVYNDEAVGVYVKCLILIDEYSRKPRDVSYFWFCQTVFIDLIAKDPHMSSLDLETKLMHLWDASKK